jgi:hypothetical protein
MEAYYRSMEKVAKEEGAAYVAEVLDARFQKTDFLDSGHFSVDGSRRLARVLAKRLRGESGAGRD